ncbi:sugar phosphate isomerase/epimerase [soil metagenome]
MNIGISSYSFNRLVAEKRLGQLEVIAKSKEMGFDAIEFAALEIPAGETPLSFAPALRAECDRVQLPAINYAVAADFLTGSHGDWKAEVERLKDEVRTAEILGTPVFRHDASTGFPRGHQGPRGFDDALPLLIKGCRAVTEFAADLGIRTTVENHGYFCQDSERLEKLVNGVNHPNFGVLADMGNFLCADEDPGQALGRLMPSAFHCHAKDFHIKSGAGPSPGGGWFNSRGGNWLRGAIIGHGDVPIAQCLRVMRQAGYDGPLSIEFEGLEDPLVGIALGLENLRRLVRQTEN